MRKHAVGLALATGLAIMGLGATGGCGPAEHVVPLEPPTGPPDVWLITLDTFRADRAGVHGNPQGLTPWLDRLARGSMTARSAYAPVPLTAPSHATLLTGLEPPNHGVRDNGVYALDASLPTLATILGESGFRTGAFIASFPLVRRFGFAQGFDEFDEALRENRGSTDYYAERPATEVTAAAHTWLRGLDRAERWFLWTHFFDPHHPLAPPPPFTKLPGLGDYEREIRALDHALGGLVRDIEIVGGGRRPVIALVTDHGEGMGDHRESSHGILLHEETMRGIFLVSAPTGTAESTRLEPGIIEPIVRYADLAPTLLDVLGLPAERFDGESLLGSPAPDRGVYGETWYPALHHGWSPLLSWRSPRWTYVEGPNPELYDRTADPGERRDVLEEHPDVARRLSERIAGIARDAEEPAILLDAAELEKLAALGYVSTGDGKLSWDPEKDPKRLVSSLNTLFRGMKLAREGRAADALPLIRRAYAADPENVLAVFELANCLRLVGDEATAISYYRRTIELTPRAAEAWAHLALLIYERGQRDEAFELLDEGMLHNPDQFPLLMTTGELRAEVGDTATAIALFENAATVEPHRPEPWLKLADLAEMRGDRDEAERLRARAARVSAPVAP